MDVLAYYIRLSFTRDKILRYTKDVRRSGATPAATRDRLEDLQKELQTLQDRLPEDLRLSSSQLLLKTHSTDREGYIFLHTLWFQCHCDLYRFLIPGIRESVSEAAIRATPPEFIGTCQRACLSNAIQLCSLWSVMHANTHNFGENPVNDIFLPISIYQVAQILRHLRHLLPPPPHQHCLEKLRKQLCNALDMAWSMPNLPARIVICLRDVERVLRLLDYRGKDTVPESQVTTTVNAESSTDKDDDNDDGGQAAYDMDHLLSRHSLIHYVNRGSGEVEESRDPVLGSMYSSNASCGDGNICQSRSTLDMVPSNFPLMTHVGHDSTRQAMLSLPRSMELGSPATFHRIPDSTSSPPSQPPLPPNASSLHQTVSTSQDGTQAIGSLWDPFTMELNGYYDPSLDQLLMLLTD